jgi:hypothetical protein
VKQRTAQQVGDLVRDRRTALRLTQDAIPGVSSATVRKIEAGIEEGRRPATVVALTEALGWPRDALDRLAAGEDPKAFTVRQVSAASGAQIPDDLTAEELADVVRYAQFVRSQRQD